ncbi:MAG: S8 family serine peptidase [Crocinitomicaceae bacterium]
MFHTVKTLLVVLTAVLSQTLVWSQNDLPSFYKNRLPEQNKEFYVGVKWINGISQSDKIERYEQNGWKFYRMNSQELEEHWKNNRIEQIYLPVQKPLLTNDSARHAVGVDKIQAAVEPIPVPFEGTDIVYGYVDSGMDYNHADFRNADSSTRVLYYWDQSKPVDGTTPTKYGYGQTCDSASINAGTCLLNDNGTHGSTVAGIGSGNGLATGRHKGMAPKTDIIMVQTDFNQPNWTITVADAIDYIFSMADTLGKPCVINTSVGDYLGSHDGLDPAGHIVDSLINEKPGRIIVASAGNSGHLGNYHLKHVSHALDTNFFWVDYNASSAFGLGAAYFSLWADTANFNNLHFSISADKHVGGYDRRAQSSYYTISDISPGSFLDTLYSPAGDTIAKYEIYTTEINGLYHFEFYVEEPDSNDYYFGFNVTGEGVFDVWTGKWMGISDIIQEDTLPTNSEFPLIDHYILPDNLTTLVSSWTCLESVVTVANLTHQLSYYDFNNNLVTLPGQVGYLSSSSSRGPNRTGQIKPEIAAPGDLSLSAVALAYKNSLISGNQLDKLSQDGWHTRNGGTSMASPVLGGVAALYLERCPLGNWQDFKSKTIASAVSDSYTGFTPNMEWGYGKLDAFKLLSLSGPNLIISGDTAICDGLPAILSLNQFYDTIGWSTGSNNLSIQIFSEQYVYAYAEDQLGCWDRTDSIFVREGTTPSIATISEIGGGLLGSAGDFYQWYVDGNLIDDATTQFIYPEVNGFYTVQVMDSAGCYAISDPLYVGFAGLVDDGISTFQLYPNPTQDQIQIQSVNPIGKLEIFSMEGKLLHRETFQGKEAQIDLSAYENGVYLFQFNTNQRVKVVKN